jgi:formylmethanofuran dehydrogenase subunit C
VTLTLTLREAPIGPVDASALRPDRLAGLSRSEIERLELRHGNRSALVGEFFDVSGEGNGEVRVTGDLKRVTHLGAHMTAGELVVEGDAGSWAGAGMRGGRLTIRGSAGRRLGAELAGARMRGGEILVHGDAGEEAGAGLRRGLIAVAGRAGAGAGVRALAGTIVALGGLGAHPGLAMRRATLVAPPPVTPPPTYALACTYRPPFLSICLRRLRALGLPVGDEWLTGRYARWSGDRLELGRAEILVLES